MGTQGGTIAAIACALETARWQIVFKCVPNRAHVGVVPIPVTGGAKQRYPDIVASRGQVLRLIEVEPVLSEVVANDIVERFTQQREALAIPALWELWRERIRTIAGIALPSSPLVEAVLVYLRPSPTTLIGAEILRAAQIRVYAAEQFEP